ncbi:hypothetical protein JMJ35_002574 [Cladonia borealis]|uniref:Phospholipid metabolism enzyme regulator n=1 Tax=Cladonia borealis TaxID=184061 RepID=A0AA39R7F5_9LECA|nr:hypothetical protein JMJ35_002574 [Cladonia borealis]
MAKPAEGPNNDETKADGEDNSYNARYNGRDASTTSTTTDNSKSSSSSPPSDRTQTSTTPHISSPSSAVASPKSSREGSPQRPPLKPGITIAGPRPTRSRKNSQDLSPVRAQSTSNSIPSVPSAAAVQRKLSAPTIPHLPPPTTPDSAADLPRPQKVNKVSSGSNTPRLRSPPPAASSGSNKTLLANARKSDQFQPSSTTPSIVLERPSRTSTLTNDSDVGEEERPVKQGMRTPVRGISGSGSALETVQESSLPSTPAIGTGKPTQAKQGGPNDRPDRIEENPMEEALARDTQSLIGSGNESTGHKSGDAKPVDEGKERRKSTTAANSAKPMGVHPKRSYSQLPFTKSKTATDASVKNMSVETETVSSIPQVALGGGAGERNVLSRTETGGSLRLKPSQETVRPKKEKEKKKAVRKAPSLNAGTASSKADIFEAKVASAVNETNSSDSEETFVYESNPPEPQSARPHRFHSRTPSATSIKSQIRQEPNHSVVGKKSMKFSNNYNSINYGNDGGEGTVRGPHQSTRTSGSNTPHHHHIGRFGRGGHASILNDSPFPNATKSVRSATNHLGQVSPRYGSPRSPHVLNVVKGSRKAEEVMSYDLEGEAADDERAPLLGSMRAGRNRRRPLPGSVRQMYSDDRDHRVCGRVTAFTILGSVLTILIAAIVAICILCAKPLLQVRTKGVEGVTASEAEIIFDLRMQAINPNIVSVQVSDLDINVFAKSKYVGTGEYWRNHPHGRWNDSPAKSDRTSPLSTSIIPDPPPNNVHHSGGVDKGTDPIDDPTTDSQTMLLGRIFQFDSPLIFDPSPFQQKPLDSVGEVKLMKPGNATEEGGSQRWERILLHDFELIVRGVMKYSSPISSKVHSATINGTKLISPSKDLDEKDPNTSKGVNKGTGGVKTSTINLRRTIPPDLRPQAGGVRLEFNA